MKSDFTSFPKWVLFYVSKLYHILFNQYSQSYLSIHPSIYQSMCVWVSKHTWSLMTVSITIGVYIPEVGYISKNQSAILVYICCVDSEIDDIMMLKYICLSFRDVKCSTQPIKSFRSQPSPVTIGVPQGSVMGPHSVCHLPSFCMAISSANYTFQLLRG